MGNKVWLSNRGCAVDPQDATISVFDRGFLYGDSVYETVRTLRGVPVELGLHLARLHRSAAGIAMKVPFSDAEVRLAIDTTLKAANNIDSRIRIVVTRGTGPVALDIRRSERPLLVVYVESLSLPTAAAYRNGISAVMVDIRQGDAAGLKTGNYLTNILALTQAIQRRGDDAIMCNAQGAVAEGATSNLFMVEIGEGETPTVRTPSLATGILEGITRRAVIELASELGFVVTETTISPEELRGADEIFLTSSIRGVMPVSRLDGAVVGRGMAGDCTTRIRLAYEQHLRENVGASNA